MTPNFEQEADTIAETLEFNWFQSPRLDPEARNFLQKEIVLALQAAYQKAIEDSAELVRVVAAHNEQAYSGNKDVARLYRQTERAIRALQAKDRFKHPCADAEEC